MQAVSFKITPKADSIGVMAHLGDNQIYEGTITNLPNFKLSLLTFLGEGVENAKMSPSTNDEMLKGALLAAFLNHHLGVKFQGLTVKDPELLN